MQLVLCSISYLGVLVALADQVVGQALDGRGSVARNLGLAMLTDNKCTPIAENIRRTEYQTYYS